MSNAVQLKDRTAAGLAAVFVRRLRAEIGPVRLEQANDHCDANQTMLDAFKELFGREANLDGPVTAGDWKTMSDAWNLARDLTAA
jgi:hypothetical protein